MKRIIGYELYDRPRKADGKQRPAKGLLVCELLNISLLVALISAFYVAWR